MTHLKKSLALLLAFVMIFSSMSVAASAADGELATSTKESATFTVKFFRQNSDGEWVETTKAAPGDHVKARAYVSTNFATHAFASALLFDTDFFEMVRVTTSSSGTTTQAFPQNAVVPHISNTNYVANGVGGTETIGSLTASERYNADADDFFLIPIFKDNDIISEADLAGKELVSSQIVFPGTSDKTVVLTDNLDDTDASNDNWYDEYDFIVRSNSTTKTVNEEGVAEVPSKLRGTLKTGSMGISTPFIDLPKGELGVPNHLVTILGFGWEIADENFKSNEGVLSTTGSVVLNANGGEFSDGEEVTVNGIIKDSVYAEVTAKEADVTRTNHNLIGWSKIKTQKGAEITDAILNEIAFGKMSDSEIAALGWKVTSQLLGFLPNTEGVEAGAELTAEMIAALDLKNKTATQLQGYGLKVTSEILAALAVDEQLTKYDYEDYTLYALWDNSGVAEYKVETYLMNTDGTYSSVPTFTDSFYTAAGTVVPLQATTRPGFTFDAAASSTSVKVEADNSSVLKAYYTRNEYTLTFIYEDISGKHKDSELLYFGEPLPEFDSLPASEVELYMLDDAGNKISVLPETMPEKDVTIYAEISIIYLFDAGENGSFPSTGERTMTYVYKFGEEVIIPEAPEMNGYEFVDWDIDIPETATGDLSFNAMYNPLQGTEKEYTVTFYDANGEVIDSNDGLWYGYEFEAVDIPEGYGENVWQLADGTVVSFPYIVTEDTAFYPVSENANVYNAYFYEDKDAAEPYATNPTTYGEAIEAPEKNPSKNGYDFKGWSTNPDATAPEELGVMDSIEGKKFYPVFIAKDVTLTFDPANGSAEETVDTKYGADVEVPEEPEKDGYTFGGWFDAAGNKLPATAPAEDTVYTAKWTANTYNVIYKNGAELVGEVETKKTDAIVTVRDGAMLQKTGYVFAGWMSNADNVIYNNPTDEESPASFTMPASEVILTAQWNPTLYVITLDATDGQFANGKDTFSKDDLIYETALANVVPADPTDPTGKKTFKGWADADDALEAIVYGPGELQKITMPAESLNLVAVWADAVVPTYDATFIANGGMFDGDKTEITIPYQAGATIVPPVPTRTDGEYTFTWVPALPANNIMPAKDMTFVAVWEEVLPGNVQYTITPMLQILNEDGTTSYIEGTVLTKSGDEGKTVEITDGTSTADIHWAYSGLVKSESNIPDPENALNNLTLTLEEGKENELVAYFKLATRTVEYDANGGTFADAEDAQASGLHGEKVTLPTADDITKPGFELLGWKDEKGEVLLPGTEITFTADEEYEAVWNEIKYTLTFEEDGGSPVPADPKLAEGAAYILPIVSKEGYRFNGWKAEDETVYNAGQTFVMPAEDATLTAQWTKVYNVIYKDADGNIYDEIVGKAAEGESVPVLTKSNPEKDDHRFAGWKNMPEDGKMPAGDLVLEPIFKEIFTLSYNYEYEGDGLPELPASEELIAGETTIIRALPELEGYEFIGWTYDGNTYAPWDNFTMPEGDVELIVSWFETYSLTFDEKGGSEVDDVRLKEGDEYKLPASSKDGYVFKGWNDGVQTYQAGDMYAMPGFKITLTAIWKIELTTEAPTTAPTYTIGFKYDGEAPEGATKLDTNISVKGGEPYRLPQIATVEGYEFDYWYDENGVKYPKDFEYIVKGDMMFTAKIIKVDEPTTAEPTEPTIPATYKISFDYAAGKPEGAPELPRDIPVTDGQTHELPNLPELEGYDFDGWYDENGVRYPAGYKYKVTGDVTLTAKWSEVTTAPTEPETTEPTTTEASKYALTFEYAEGAPANAPALPAGKELKAGEAFKLPSLADVEGYTFKGWKDENGASYPAGYNFRMPAEATVLYAVYEEIITEPTKYTLTFDENGGVAVADKELLPGAIINLPKTSLEGSTFLGWDDGEKLYAAGDAFEMPAANTTLTAKWEKIVPKTYTVEYEYIGDDKPANAPALPASSTVAEGSDVVVAALPAAVEGYEFFGWYYNGIKYNAGDKFTMPSADIVIEGFWIEETELFIVSYEYEGDVPANAAEIPAPKTYEKGKTVTVESVPAKVEGYTFAGWYLDNDRTAPVTSFTVTADTAIVGVWSINKNDIVLNANGGEFEENDSEHFTVDNVDYGTDLEDVLPDVPQKPGYTFDGWEGYPSDGKMPDGDVELTAKWKINEYTITFDSNGGSAVPPATYDFGETVVAPADPTREGFDFKGWEPALPPTMPANDLTVKAVWEAKPGVETNKFVADANGGAFADGSLTVNKELAEGEAIGELPVPTRDGYEFKGWDGMPSDGKMPGADLTVKAIWEEKVPEVKSHKVNYYLVKGEGAAAVLYTSKEFEEGAAMSHPTPVVEGFTFKGWTDKDGNALPATMGTEDIDAYAKLEINSYKVTYLLDGSGAVYKEYEDVVFGSEVPRPEDPTKEGYLFERWEPNVDATMPAHDVTYTAKWIVPAEDEYIARYVVDGETYRRFSLKEGAEIPVPEAPTKFGFVFVGWEPEVPSTMPAENLEFVAQWEVDKTFVTIVIGGTVVSGAVIGTVIGMNAALITGISIVGGIIVIIGAAHLVKHTHTVTFMVDGEVYKVYKVVEGTKIPVPADPAKDGAEFAGWNPEVPEKMGNTDLVFEATWEDVGADVDVVIPDTGSVAGVAAFAIISGAAAAAYVITRKKKED
ncbi:MAG: InlB B-repeat-containing protein [Clostridia bacterium]|nr:InlB B-repeat-containing protein [Clostridia bacterium]